MSHLKDGPSRGRMPQQPRHQPMTDWPGDSFSDPHTVRSLQHKLDFLASHMQSQLTEHQAAMANTRQVFESLLQDLPVLCECFQQAFAVREPVPGDYTTSRIYHQIDPDRSVGILNILWHALSFTTRGNTKPLALNRPGRPPVFTGRIIAFHGDFLDVTRNLQSQEFPELLHHEIASLYVPADPSAPAVMKIKHLAGEELYFHQIDAPRRFLLKTVEIICGGGFFHEQ